MAHEDVRAVLARADLVFHLAGVNRPRSIGEFDDVNRGFTVALCETLAATGRPIPLIFSSSTQAALDNPYGSSKRAAEQTVERYGATTGARVHVLRLPNVFGKWSRPNYNSVVATFCHNLARGIPITIHDPGATMELVYIDDVVGAMTRLIDLPPDAPRGADVEPIYRVTVGELAETLRGFAESRETRMVPPAGAGFIRKLYATFLAYHPPDGFAYALPRHEDARGVFVEMLRTPSCGQVSYFTAHPGVTRGGHYHHTKSEKFLIIQGRARFRFRHVATGDAHEIVVSAVDSRVVDTAPGWAHDVTNIGDDELIVMLWANELFDPTRPDTVGAALDP